MNKIVTLLLILVTMTACQKRNKTFHIDPELQSQYDSFVAAAASRGQDVRTDDLIMKVADVVQNSNDGTILAYCRLSMDSSVHWLTLETTETPVVVVDRNYFNNANSTNLGETSTHELGHCILGLKHKNSYGYYTFNSGARAWVPTSMMNMYSVSMTIGTAWYNELKESYLDELFGLKSSALTSDTSVIAKAQTLKSNQKLVFESISTSKGCAENLKVEDKDSVDTKVTEDFQKTLASKDQ